VTTTSVSGAGDGASRRGIAAAASGVAGTVTGFAASAAARVGLRTTRQAPPSTQSPAQQAAGEPPWARPAVGVLAAFAAVMFGWQASRNGVNPLYASAARSMTESWHAFFYNAIDPASSITLDKLGGFVWPEAISARIFGFHAWSLALPVAIEGVITVVVMYRLVRRWAGPAAGVAAAGLFTLTPVIASLFGRSGVEDAALTMCLVLAASAWQKAVASGRLRSLLLAGFWVGAAFQAKMAEAWAVVPAFAIVYLIAAPPRLRKRAGHVLAAGVLALAVSFAWMTAIQLTPAGDRPYIDGSTNNNVFSMVLGYNALGRFGSLGVSSSGTGSVPGFGGGFRHGGARGGAGAAGTGAAGTGAAGTGTADQAAGGRASGTTTPNGSRMGAAPGTGAAATQGGRAAAGGPGGPPGGGIGGAGGWLKLFSANGFVSQIGWLYPLAALALVFGIVSRRRQRRIDVQRAGYLMWGLWVAAFGFAFSAGQVPHSHYTAVMAPGIAAMAGAGIVAFIRRYRIGGRSAWLLPSAVAATAGWATYLSSQYSSFLPWLRPTVAVLGLVGCVILVAGLLDRRAVSRAASRAVPRGMPRIVAAGAVAGVLAMVVTPAAWAVSVFDSKYDGNGINASAGPVAGMGGGAGGRAGQFSRTGNRGAEAQGRADEAALRDIMARFGRGGGGGPMGFGNGPGGGLQPTASEEKLVSYLRAHSSGAKYLMAVQGSNSAATYIASTGASVLPMGGFSGSVPFPTLAQFQKLVSTGLLHYVMSAGAGGGGMFGGSGKTASTVFSWVTNHCTVVPASAYGGTVSSAAASADAGGGGFPAGRPGGTTGSGTGAATGNGASAAAGPAAPGGPFGGASTGKLYRCG
jgi:4-amino-4-deoxy-L-arabinose transferase-like glycosyltransferase